MKKLNYIASIAFFAILFTLPATAQVKAGNRKYAKLAYSSAIVRYERALRKDSGDVQVWARLAECYRLTQNSKLAERAFGKVVSSGVAAPDQHFHYVQALMQNERYEQATKALKVFSSSAPQDTRVANLEKGINELAAMKAMEGVYKVSKINVNSNANDFAPIIYNGGLVFMSSRPITEWVGFTHEWAGERFYSLYFAKGADGNFSDVKSFGKEILTDYNDGPVCFNQTGSQMYFTRNNVQDGKRRKDAKDITRLKIFFSQFSDGKWGIDVPFAFNSDDYSCAHPALSADGKTLYFSSDMPGTIGGMDLWKCTYDGTNWQKPENLGSMYNTAGNELFPHIALDGKLYFSSNGLQGMGGLDLYECEPDGVPRNMGAPVNSSDDDFAMCTGIDGNTGYFSSNRKSQKLNDDIYYFKKQCTNADVVIVDQKSGEPLKDAMVAVFENGKSRNSVTTDSTGRFNMCLNPLSNYEFKASKNSYEENKSSLTSSQVAAAAASGTEVKVPLAKKSEKIVHLAGRVFNQDDKSGVPDLEVILRDKTSGQEWKTTANVKGEYKFENLPLDHSFEVITAKKDCGDVKEPFSTGNILSSKTIAIDLPLLCKGDIIKIENIYYDYNKYNIRPDAALELDKVIAVLNKYPTMAIELRSHTDARGKDEYNRKLSDNRAKSAVEYIISKGIDKNRLVAKGYGETELLNQCKDGVECDDKTHEQNRRTEFKILNM
jgi:outer membrane protein OmpA-like peptidoglycan-associated protein/tetratricopeptide (TPR) repeat protein